MNLLKFMLLIAFILLLSYILSIVVEVEEAPEPKKTYVLVKCEYIGNEDWECIQTKVD